MNEWKNSGEWSVHLDIVGCFDIIWYFVFVAYVKGDIVSVFDGFSDSPTSCAAGCTEDEKLHALGQEMRCDVKRISRTAVKDVKARWGS